MRNLLFILCIIASFSVSAQERPSREPVLSTNDSSDSEAEFPGGVIAMNEWMAENSKFPKKAIDPEEQGIVYVQFVVDRDGSIKDPEIIRGLSPKFNEEALRLVNSMPTWTPAYLGGEAVRTKLILPIDFRLPEPTNEEIPPRRNQ